MSRIGRLPVVVPAGVTVEVKENNYVVVKGSKGTLERNLPVEMDIKVEDGHVVVTRPNDLKKMKALHGLTFQHQFSCKVIAKCIFKVVFINREYYFSVTEGRFVFVGFLNIKRSQCRHPSVTVDNVGTPAKLLHCFQHTACIKDTAGVSLSLHDCITGEELLRKHHR